MPVTLAACLDQIGLQRQQINATQLRFQRGIARGEFGPAADVDTAIVLCALEHGGDFYRAVTGQRRQGHIPERDFDRFEAKRQRRLRHAGVEEFEGAIVDGDLFQLHRRPRWRRGRCRRFRGRDDPGQYLHVPILGAPSGKPGFDEGDIADAQFAFQQAGERGCTQGHIDARDAQLIRRRPALRRGHAQAGKTERKPTDADVLDAAASTQRFQGLALDQRHGCEQREMHADQRDDQRRQNDDARTLQALSPHGQAPLIADRRLLSLR